MALLETVEAMVVPDVFDSIIAFRLYTDPTKAYKD